MSLQERVHRSLLWESAHVPEKETEEICWGEWLPVTQTGVSEDLQRTMSRRKWMLQGEFWRHWAYHFGLIWSVIGLYLVLDPTEVLQWYFNSCRVLLITALLPNIFTEIIFMPFLFQPTKVKKRKIGMICQDGTRWDS